jgi:hypothetical protein
MPPQATNDVERASADWVAAQEQVAKVEAQRASHEKRIAAITAERARAASTDAELYRQLSLSLADHRAEVERLGIVLEKSSADCAQAKARCDRAEKGAKRAAVAAAERDMAEAIQPFLGFLIPLMREVGRMQRASMAYRNAIRAAGLRADGPTVVDRLLGALPVRFDQIGELFGHHVLQEAALEACKGAGCPPYSRGDIPYPAGMQLNDWMKGTFIQRARDYESRQL